MDYEKKYKEAFELMNDCIPDEDGLVHVRPCDIFPELAESEDERIRKEIISMFETLDRKDWIAWLEKQSEHTDIPVDAVLDGNKDGLIADTIRLKYGDGLEWTSEQMQDNCELVEQKPWSEEDEWCLEQINFLIRNSYSVDDKVERLSNWLNSVRPQSTWRPSEMEMKALEFCLEHNIDKDGVFGSKVVKLYDELKKLKG